jgi:hypothetical protein
MFIELPSDSQVTRVQHETHSREFGYVALDRRRTFLFASTNLRNIATGIDAYAKEEVGRSTMFSCASLSSKRGYAGNFRFERCARSELPARIQEYRPRFDRVILCPTLRSAWKLGDTTDQKSKDAGCEDELLVVESDS